MVVVSRTFVASALTLWKTRRIEQRWGSLLERN